MKSDDPFGFRPHWNALMRIYGEFTRICQKYGLRYWVVEGNAIGALRHKGFVPWDDDLDVAMPRPDYEKFVKLANSELSPNLKFWDWRDLRSWRFTFGKIQEINEENVLVVEKAVGHKLSSGLYIDILVVDGLPKSVISRCIYKARMFVLGCVVRRRTTDFFEQTFNGAIAWMVGFCASVIVGGGGDVLPVMEKIDALMKSVPFENAEQTWRAGAAIRVTMEFPRKIWDGEFWTDFDGVKVPLPIGYDEYLRTQYGDYMKMPPIDKRVPSHVLEKRFPWWLGPV